MADENIDEKLKELDDAIINNRGTVLDLFEQLESSMGEKSSAYRSLVQLKKTSYLKALENSSTLKSEQNMVNTFLVKWQEQLKNLESQAKEETLAVCNIQTDTSIQNDIRNCLNQIKSILSGDAQRSFYTELELEIMEFSKSSVNSLNEYIAWDWERSRIRVGLYSLQTQILGDLEHPVSVTKNVLFLLFIDLCYYLICVQYQRKVDFVGFALFNKSELRSIVFTHIPLTEERIQLNAKKLLFLFHPDHCELEQKSMFTEMLQLLIDNLNDQLRMLANDRANRVNLVEQYKAMGKEQWAIAVEYQSARKREWFALKRLNRAVLINLTEGELKHYQNYYAISAYEYYRAAARELSVAAGEAHIAEQVELQKYMALTLHLAGDGLHLETQIYAIIGIYLLVTNNRNNYSRDDFEALEKLLLQIRHAETTSFIASANTDGHDKHESVWSQAAMAFKQGSSPLQQFQNSILSELRINFLNKSLFRDGEEIKSNTRPTSVPSGIGIGTSYLIGDLLFGHRSVDKSHPNVQDPHIHELLRKILTDALQHYNKGQYSDFLYSLTTRYAPRKVLLGIRQIDNDNKCTILLDIRPKVIVTELLSYHFSPEGIANFLVLIGEVLLSAPQLKPKNKLSTDISVVLPKYNDFINSATMLFDEVLTNLQLIEQAKDFQRKIKSKMSLAIEKRLVDIEKTTSNYTYSVSNDYVKEKLHVPTTIRLEEVKIVARVNYVVAKMISGGTENLQQSVRMIKSVKEEFMKNLANDKMFPVTEIRLQALTDMLIVLGFPDDILSPKTEVLFSKINYPQIESEVLVKNIDKVLTSNETVLHCQPVFFSEDGDVDEFVLLDQVLSGVLKLDIMKFVKNVCNHYYKNIEPVTSRIKEIIKKENFGDIKEWKTEFLKRKHSLTFQYLPLVSVMYNLIFLPCIVKSHRVHKRIFVPMSEVLDFSNGLAKISIYVLTDGKERDEDIRPIKGIFVVSEIALNYLHNQLDSATDRKAKVYLINQIALYHREQAEKIDKTHHLEALQKWNNAKNFYDQLLKLNGNHLTGMLGYARCLIMLCKYTAAEKFLVDNAEGKEYFRDAPERWLLLGMLRRKLQKYDEAKNAIENALKLKKKCTKATREWELIKKLQRETLAQRMELYKKASLMHVEPNSKHYNILSIDGGGIRGLIPAVWLSELERRTQLSTSSMFHMMAGTSTGGIIAAGLSIPDKPGFRRPRYRAADLVELYTTHANRVFSRSSFVKSLFGLASKYTDEGRKTLLEEYFGDIRLSQALTDLLIKAVNSGNSTTELFRRSDALTDPSRNHKVVDILMCTSAAPTYFPSYPLKDCVFVDGGVQANNPAMFAYSDACNRHINREKMFMLSLGTGDFVPDPLNPNAQRHLLFWLSNASNVLKVIFDGPQNNIAAQLSNIFENDKYHRWQIWLENPITLDDIRNEALDRLKELARADFEEMEASDGDNRLGKLIERLKDH